MTPLVGILIGLLVATVLATVVAAGPAAAAAAAGDPTRPSGQVVYGPNCTDGFIRVAIINGNEPHTLTMTYDGVPAGPATEVAAEERTTLEGREVDWGSTVALTVAVVGPTGVEASLDFLDYTRPTEEDCALVAPPTGPDPTSAPPTTSPPTTSPPTSTPPTTAPTTIIPPTTTRPVPSTTVPSPTPTTRPVPTPTTPRPSAPSSTTPASPPDTTQPPGTPGGTTGAPAPSGPLNGTVSSDQVFPGSVVTVRGTGFTPGEQVVVSLGGVAVPLATVTADEQGRVEAVVQIPRDVVLGPSTVQLLGQDSAASTAVDLRVAAVETADDGRGTPWPLMVAGLALLVVAAALAAAAARRPRRDDWAQPGATD